MMQSNNKIAFSVEVLHTYFENGICDCLLFVPSASTMNLLKKFGFNIRNQINGFEFYINAAKPMSPLFNYIGQTTGQNYFDFQMVTTDTEFTLYTDISTDWLGQLMFDSQSGSNKYDGGIVLLGENLSSEQDVSSIGNLKIYFEDILKYQNENGFAAFEIQLTARSTQWQYYVINKSAVQLDNPSIIGKTGISFEGPENVTIQSGQKALLFSSGDNLLPLSEVPKYKFDLVNTPKTNGAESTKKKSGSKVLFKGLPNPDSKNIGIVNVNGKTQASSSMYVFV
jgi:hypothetical protein